MTNHYEVLAESFDQAWEFSDNYRKWMVETIASILKLKPGDLFVDIGGGTGSYTKIIAAEAGLINYPVCVEPSTAMADIAETMDGIVVYREDALTFSKRKRVYDKVLIKEVIHHISQREGCLRGLYLNLHENGKLLVVTRPKNCTLPLFKSAKESFSKQQPETSEIEDDLRKCGFMVNTHFQTYSIAMSRDSWNQMLRMRFMSNLFNFSDEEIESGIVEISAQGDGNMLQIDDSLVFIDCSK